MIFKKRLVVVGKTQIWQTGILNCLYPRMMIQGGEYITLRTFFFWMHEEFWEVGSAWVVLQALGDRSARLLPYMGQSCRTESCLVSCSPTAGEKKLNL